MEICVNIKLSKIIQLFHCKRFLQVYFISEETAKHSKVLSILKFFPFFNTKLYFNDAD